MNPANLDIAYDLTNKVAVVTGGAGVLCSGICRALATAGSKVAILDFNAPAAEALAAEIESNGGRAFGVPCNVLDKTSLETSAQVVLEKYARVDILINGAGG